MPQTFIEPIDSLQEELAPKLSQDMKKLIDLPLYEWLSIHTDYISSALLSNMLNDIWKDI